MPKGKAPTGTGVTTHSIVTHHSAITISTATHSINDVVAQFDITGVSRRAGWTVVLNDIQVYDDSNQKVELGFHFFDRTPGTSQTLSDPLAIARSDAQFRKAYASVSSYEQLTSATAAYAVGQKTSIDKIIETQTTSADLHCVVVTKAAAAWSSTNGLKFDFGFLRD